MSFLCLQPSDGFYVRWNKMHLLNHCPVLLLSLLSYHPLLLFHCIYAGIFSAPYTQVHFLFLSVWGFPLPGIVLHQTFTRNCLPLSHQPLLHLVLPQSLLFVPEPKWLPLPYLSGLSVCSLVLLFSSEQLLLSDHFLFTYCFTLLYLPLHTVTPQCKLSEGRGCVPTLSIKACVGVSIIKCRSKDVKRNATIMRRVKNCSLKEGSKLESPLQDVIPGSQNEESAKSRLLASSHNPSLLLPFLLEAQHPVPSQGPSPGISIPLAVVEGTPHQLGQQATLGHDFSTLNLSATWCSLDSLAVQRASPEFYVLLCPHSIHLT